jgi:hypothetical protein
MAEDKLKAALLVGAPASWHGGDYIAAMSTHSELAHRRRLPGPGARQHWFAGATVALSTVFFLLVNGVGLSDPGLQYDELLFVNAALGNTHPYHGFIYAESFGIPTMLMPYTGALKAWIYTPISPSSGSQWTASACPSCCSLLPPWCSRCC